MNQKINPWIPALLNFFLLGAGYIYNRKRTSFGVSLTLVALFATFVEFSIWQNAPKIFPLAFADFFLLALVLAADGFIEARELNKSQLDSSHNS
ncbi:hypothetical protein KC644_02350 [Candidatus Berkelbacteria bacterium]|nr:hypothetical protein [Candidatus Berkelbacteria bacterium]